MLSQLYLNKRPQNQRVSKLKLKANIQVLLVKMCHYEKKCLDCTLGLGERSQKTEGRKFKSQDSLGIPGYSLCKALNPPLPQAALFYWLRCYQTKHRQ